MMSREDDRPAKKKKRAGSKGFTGIQDVLGRFDSTKDKYYSREWQSYAVALTKELDDRKHKSLYMRMARDYPRHILEQARQFVKDSQARSKARLFMWKVRELRKESEKLKAEKAKQEAEQQGGQQQNLLFEGDF